MNSTSESLSERELEILKLVATGASNKEIANDLVISTNTVKVHLRNIFSKIGVSSRTEAAMYAVNEGIINLSPDAGEAILENSVGEIQKPRVNWGIIAALLVPAAILFIAVAILILVNTQSESAPSVPSDPEIRWEELASLPASQTGMAVAVIDNQIYSIAGKSEGNISNLSVKFDPQENKWESIPPKPTAVSDIGAAVIGNLIYIPGGIMETGEVFNGLEIYDPRSEVWTTGAPVPVPVSSYAIAAYEGKLYLFGGWDGEDYLNLVFEYDPEDDRWEEKSPLPSARKYASAVSSSGSIYVIGGFDGEQALAKVDVYTPSLEKGNEGPWRSATSLPEGRYGMGAVEMSDVIYVIGGESGAGGELSPVSFSTQEQTWQKILDKNPRKWIHLGLASLGPKIYAIGGEVNNLPSRQTSAYQLLFITVLPIVP